MFELSIALKYLRPRWRQLSVSIISLISILVIALVVWLIVVFFSVTQGLERNWIQKLISLTAPIRITPTDEYYQSYYYLVDSISSNSNYTLKSIREKLHATDTDPYESNLDEEVPKQWPLPFKKDGETVDLVKKTFQITENLPIKQLYANDYEVTGCNLKLRLLRDKTSGSTLSMKTMQSSLSQACYLGSLDPKNQSISKTLLKTSLEDLNNLLRMIVTQDSISDNESFQFLPPNISQEHLRRFFQHVKVSKLITPIEGWVIPKALYPQNGETTAFKISKNEKTYGLWVTQSNHELFIKDWQTHGFEIQAVNITFKNKKIFINDEENRSPLHLEGKTLLPAQVIMDSLDRVHYASHILFDLDLQLPGIKFTGQAPLGKLALGQAEVIENHASPFWLYQKPGNFSLVNDPYLGEAILLPKSFREVGVLLGDHGFLTYYSPTVSSVQEQRLPFYVAGFYDQGIISIGGKFIFANPEFVNVIRSSQMQESNNGTNGINVFFDLKELSKVKEIKKELELAFEKEGIAPYWKVTTYEEYDFTKDILQQLRSDKNLFLIIATVIIIVACSNIISMLIILVNDKKLEIGILRSMGASSLSIATIFGFCGIAIGVLGSLIGTLTAAATLKNLDLLVYVLSKFQGHQAFNPLYYGDALPNQMSLDAALFVIISTAIISLISGIVPAIKAGMLRPSHVLRSE